MQLAPFACLCVYPFVGHLRFSKKKTLLLTTALIAGCAAIFSSVGAYLASVLPGDHALWQAVNVVFMLCLLPCLFWYIYTIKAIWQKKLFVFSFTLTCALSITSISNVICSWIYLGTPSDGLPYRGYTILVLAIVTALFLPLLRLVYEKCYLPIEKDLNPRESGHLSILSLLLFFALAGGLSFINYTYLFENPMAFFLFFALMASVFIIYLLYFKMYSSAHEKYVAQSKYMQIQNGLRLLDEQYRQISESIESARRMRHDLKHHMFAIQSYLSKSDSDKAESYIRQYLTDMKAFELVTFCDHQMINMLISHYYVIAKEQGIDFIVHINIPKQLSVENPDITVLLGNLLENAVHGAAFAPQAHRRINLNMVCPRKMLAITVDNSFDGKVLQDSRGQYLSTKPEHTGIGLSSIRDIAQKYSGGVEFKHDDQEFHACVMLGPCAVPTAITESNAPQAS